MPLHINWRSSKGKQPIQDLEKLCLLNVYLTHFGCWVASCKENEKALCKFHASESRKFWNVDILHFASLCCGSKRWTFTFRKVFMLNLFSKSQLMNWNYIQPAPSPKMISSTEHKHYIYEYSFNHSSMLQVINDIRVFI